MASVVILAVGIVASTYIFLRFLLHMTQSAREPPALLTGVPFIGSLLGMIREKSRFHTRLRNTYNLPIYTLRLPFIRMYIVNATQLIPLLQKQWRTVSFAAIAADAGIAVGMSKHAVKIMHDDLTSEHGFSLSWPKFIVPAMSPGKDLDAMNRRAVEVIAEEMDGLREGKVRVGLSAWSRHTMVRATTEAVWGPQNPYADAEVVEAWRTFEAGFLTFSMFPMASTIFPKLLRAREKVVAAMTQYIRNGGHESASGLVRMRFEHHHDQFGLSIEDIARGELGNTFAVLGNTAPCAFWLLYYIVSNDRILAAVRHEVAALVQEVHGADGDVVNAVDMAGIRTSCPVLMSTFQETMRFRAVNPGPRVLLDDVHLDNQYLLKKGSMLMIPATVQHSDAVAWGDDVGQFDYMRFARTGPKKPNRVAFRAFGGGHILCPGRHFASTEIMAFAALLVLRFDVVPVGGKWVEPSCDNSPAQAGFPIPDEDIEVELRPRDATKKWNIKFSGSTQSMDIVAEDSTTVDMSGS